jgi:hypothetical protein
MNQSNFGYRRPLPARIVLIQTLILVKCAIIAHFIELRTPELIIGRLD